MVSRVEEATRRQQQQNQKGNHNKEWHHHQQQSSPMNQMIQCNKGKTSKFKRSTSNLEADGASSAILLLACIACTPSF
ncbi:MADS-box protein CMB1 [Hibiscus syriacus]|uniref:MADS-box protein CMB1 n=1 Tax=Hibiscus syriacus TaxID=106335 RepID=A0A6A3BJA0_HIBSY|nr:MADS-box protein CMB1 [Hibiscus syriacus]